MPGKSPQQVMLIEKPKIYRCRASERSAALVLRSLVFAASPKEDNLGYTFATLDRIAKYCGLTVKQVRLALSRLEEGRYIVKKRAHSGLGVIVTHFAELRRRFGVISDPEVVRATPEGMLPVVDRGKSMQGEDCLERLVCLSN